MNVNIYLLLLVFWIWKLIAATFWGHQASRFITFFLKQEPLNYTSLTICSLPLSLTSDTQWIKTLTSESAMQDVFESQPQWLLLFLLWHTDNISLIRSQLKDLYCQANTLNYFSAESTYVLSHEIGLMCPQLSPLR